MTQKLHYLTEEGRQKLEDELHQLETVRRPQVAAILKRAIEEGDLRENAGYSEGKREQALVEGRILEIRTVLRSSRDLDENDNGRVSLGGTVVIQEGSYAPETYRIVSVAEANASEGSISDESPFGRALLNHKAGDIVDVTTPGGVITVKIIEQS